MAIAIIVEIPGGTLEQYEQVSEAMRLKDVEEAPAGMMIHFAGLAGDSLVVIDVWESREAYDRPPRRERGPRSSTRSVGNLPPYTHREFEVYKTR